MWPQHIGPILAGVAGLITALAGVFALPPRRVSRQLQNCIEEREQCRQEADQLREQVLVALRHIFRLEKALTMAGKKPPARPEGLDL